MQDNPYIQFIDVARSVYADEDEHTDTAHHAASDVLSFYTRHSDSHRAEAGEALFQIVQSAPDIGTAIACKLRNLLQDGKLPEDVAGQFMECVAIGATAIIEKGIVRHRDHRGERDYHALLTIPRQGPFKD